MHFFSEVFLTKMTDNSNNKRETESGISGEETQAKNDTDVTRVESNNNQQQTNKGYLMCLMIFLIFFLLGSGLLILFKSGGRNQYLPNEGDAFPYLQNKKTGNILQFKMTDYEYPTHNYARWGTQRVWHLHIQWKPIFNSV